MKFQERSPEHGRNKEKIWADGEKGWGGVGVVVPEDVGRWVYVCLSERSLMSNQNAKIEKTSNTKNWQRCETNRTLKLC